MNEVKDNEEQHAKENEDKRGERWRKREGVSDWVREGEKEKQKMREGVSE